MSNPADAATQKATGSTPSFADLVDKAIKEAKQDDKGNLVLPEDLDESVKYAATIEKRRRDTQAAYTRDRQKLTALEAEKATLFSEVVGDVKLELTDEQVNELEELKFSDPEAWRRKVNDYEKVALQKKRTSVEEKLKQVSTSALDNDELERRKTVLEEFVKSHAGFTLNDDIIANDIPPRISKKLEKGEITFDQFLETCFEYLTTGKTVKTEATMEQPNLRKVPGGASPSDTAVKEDIISSYENEIY